MRPWDSFWERGAILVWGNQCARLTGTMERFYAKGSFFTNSKDSRETGSGMHSTCIAINTMGTV